MWKIIFLLWNVRDNVFNLVTEVVANANAKVQYGAVDNLAEGNYNLCKPPWNC